MKLDFVVHDIKAFDSTGTDGRSFTGVTKDGGKFGIHPSKNNPEVTHFDFKDVNSKCAQHIGHLKFMNSVKNAHTDADGLVHEDMIFSFETTSSDVIANSSNSQQTSYQQQLQPTPQYTNYPFQSSTIMNAPHQQYTPYASYPQPYTPYAPYPQPYFPNNMSSMPFQNYGGGYSKPSGSSYDQQWAPHSFAPTDSSFQPSYVELVF